MLSNRILTVSQVNSYIKLLFEGDKNLKNIFISGEISNFRVNFSSGHLYFSLNEEGNTIKAVMFSNNLKRLRFSPLDGMNVIVRGSISTYETAGQYQIYVEDMQPSGVGEEKLKIDEIKRKLEKEGIFARERKKIPKYPTKVGVITSLSGAVLYDIKSVINRRYPLCSVKLQPVSVQGEKAEQNIVGAIENFNSQKSKVSVIILARGGGAAEDLSVFNKEGLARAVANSNIPIISAIGHETDWTICDCAADIRASTPSVAAELAVPDRNEIEKQLFIFKKQIKSDFYDKINIQKAKLEYLYRKFEAESPKNKISLKKEKIDNLKKELKYNFKEKINKISEKINYLESKIEAMNPLKIFLKGYVFVESEKSSSPRGKREKFFSFENLKKGQVINLVGLDGSAEVIVKEARRKDFGE